MQDMSGTTIKGYELQERVGAGGFGAVYKARQTTVEREVAIKIILPGFANQPEFIRRFESEAQLVARLEHMHITPLYDYWRDPNGAYLVMRYLRGGSLRDALADGAYGPEAAALLMDQVSSALAVAHRNNVIHRDLKPGNILLDEDSNAYLADFGIAKNLALPSDETDPDEFRGTPDYISPEQARTEPVTPQTDIYSLGVVLYELLTGWHPFQNMTSVERIIKHIQEPLPPIEDLDIEGLDEVNAVIQKATQKNPAHRYADVLEMADAFRKAIALHRIDAEESIVEQLTQREQEILQLLVEGLTNNDIAGRLYITVATVRWYLRQVYKKLGARSRVQAIVRARELDLVIGSDTSIAVAGNTTSGLPEPENPYRGLQAFRAADTHHFFGRDRLIQKMLRRLGETGPMARFLAIVGASGSGKSSVVRAGLIPALWRGELAGSDRWFVVEMLPGTHPMDELEVALTRVAADQAGNLGEHLGRDERGLLRAAQLILPDDDESELVIMIDQFEELFTLVEDEARRVHFLQNIYHAVTDSRSRVRVILTLRADFYDRPLQYAYFGELIQNRTLTVLPLSASELESAIAAPARSVGVAFEPGLVASIIEEVNYQAGALPLLQYALTELFEKCENRTLTQQAYQEIGGAIGAVAKRADELFTEMNDAGQAITHQMFLRLVTLGDGTDDTRRRTLRTELEASAEDQEMLGEIIDAYAEYRLLSLDIDPATRIPTVEVAHEAILYEWSRLANWLDESRDEIRLQRQLATMTSEWRAASQDRSFLLHGSRLELFEAWAAETNITLTAEERAFLGASVAERAQVAAEQRAQQERESALKQRASSRLRALVGVFAVATVVAGILAVLALSQSRTAQAERDSARDAQQTAQREAAVNHSLAMAARAEGALEAGESDVALALALEAVDIPDPPADARRVLLEVSQNPGTRLVIDAHEGEISLLRASPDGRHALSSADEDRDSENSLHLWDLSIGNEVGRLSGHSAPVNNAVFSPDSQVILSAAANELIVWGAANGEEIRSYALDDEIEALAFTANGDAFLAGGAAVLRLFDLETGETLRNFAEIENPVRDITLMPDGEHFLTSGMGDTIIMWNLESGESVRRYEVAGVDQIRWLALHPDGGHLLAAPNGFDLRLLDLETSEEVRAQNFSSAAQQLHFLNDGAQFVIWQAGEIVIWDFNQWTEVVRFSPGRFSQDGGLSEVRLIDYDPIADVLISGSSTGEIRLWDLNQSSNFRRFETDGTPLGVLALNSDGSRLVTGSVTGDVILWNVASGQEIRRFHDESGLSITVSFSRDDQYILYGAGDRFGPTENTSLLIWDAETGALVQTFEGHNTYVRAAAFSPDGRTVLAGSQSLVNSSYDFYADLILWDVASGQPIRYFDTQHDTTQIAFIDGGRYAITTTGFDFEHIAYLWDVETGQVIRSYDGGGDVNALALSPDEKSFATNSSESVILWDVETGQILRRFWGHEADVWSIDISSDGHLMISSDSSGSVILWDVQTGDLLQHFAGHRDFSAAVRFSTDGQHAYSSSLDGSLIEWEINVPTLNELKAWAKEHRYLRALSAEEQARFGVALAESDTALTPLPTLVPPARFSETPTIAPQIRYTAHIGEQHGEIGVNEYDIWVYDGQEDEVINMSMLADHPVSDVIDVNLLLPGNVQENILETVDALHTQIVIRSPEGNVLAASEMLSDQLSTNARLDGVSLPASGVYIIEARSFRNLTAGSYTLIVETIPAETSNSDD